MIKCHVPRVCSFIFNLVPRFSSSLLAPVVVASILGQHLSVAWSLHLDRQGCVSENGRFWQLQKVAYFQSELKKTHTMPRAGKKQQNFCTAEGNASGNGKIEPRSPSFCCSQTRKDTLAVGPRQQMPKSCHSWAKRRARHHCKITGLGKCTARTP